MVTNVLSPKQQKGVKNNSSSSRQADGCPCSLLPQGRYKYLSTIPPLQPLSLLITGELVSLESFLPVSLLSLFLSSTCGVRACVCCVCDEYLIPCFPFCKRCYRVRQRWKCRLTVAITTAGSIREKHGSPEPFSLSPPVETTVQSS